MKKWMTFLLITFAASISACSFPGHEDAGEIKSGALTVQQEQLEQGQEEKDKNNKENETTEQGMITVFSNLMSLKLPQGLEVQSNETSDSKIVYTDSHKKVTLEMRYDPEQLVSDAEIDKVRLKMKVILENDSEGEKLKWLKNETWLVHGKHIAINEVIMPSQEGDTYRLVGWAELNGALLEIYFSAPASEKDEWQTAVQEMIESIQM
ncbi:hypothetical protein [Paenibacillus dendritiformis]|uniref:hypothetical protein n=1 Tax=Paenibacillus dendritiformis TaxID=130049 RepID=UPI001F0F2FAB|nr:hypothetical protein [Paenibacillus dendritiformis]